MGQPEGIAGQVAQVHAIRLAGAGVEHGDVTVGFHGLAESHCAGRYHLLAGVLGAGSTGTLPLPVEDQRVSDPAPIGLYQLHEVLSLFDGLGHCDRLGEEIEAYVQSSGQGPFYVGLKITVYVEGAHGVPPVARPDHGELHPGGGHCLPVHLLLMGRYVNANGIRSIGIRHVGAALPAGEDLEALGEIGVGANLPLRRDIAEDAVKFLPGVHLRFGGRLRAGAPVRVRAFRWLGALARLRRRLWGRLRLRLLLHVIHQHGGHLTPLGLTLGIKAVAVLAVDHAVLLGPVCRLGGPSVE